MCSSLLDDGTGKLMIVPSGSELQLENPRIDAITGRSRWRLPALRGEICVLGTLQENPSARKDPVRESSSLSRIGQGLVSADEADLLRREYFPALNPALPSGAQIAPLERFDLHPPSSS